MMLWKLEVRRQETECNTTSEIGLQVFEKEKERH